MQAVLVCQRLALVMASKPRRCWQERVNVQSVEVRVDAALIEQLRAGYAQLSERSAKACLPLPGGAGVAVVGPSRGAAPHKSRPGYHLCENGDLERREGSLVYVMVRQGNRALPMGK
jgi:hypothetical protein